MIFHGWTWYEKNAMSEGSSDSSLYRLHECNFQPLSSTGTFPIPPMSRCHTRHSGEMFNVRFFTESRCKRLIPPATSARRLLFNARRLIFFLFLLESSLTPDLTALSKEVCSRTTPAFFDGLAFSPIFILFF